MPVYSDPETGKRIRSEHSLTDADLEEAFASTAQPSALQRAGQYLLKRGGEVGGAAQRIGSEMFPAWVDRPAGTPPPEERGMLDRLGDLATVAAPVIAPGLTVAGLAVGTGASAAGAEPETAELLDVGTQIGAGGVQVARGIGRALTSGQDVVAQGERLSTAVPGMRQAVSAARAKAFDPVIDFGMRQGLGVSPKSPQGVQLFKALTQAQQDFGPLANPAERRVVTGLLKRLTDPAATPLTPVELDDALLGLNKTKAFAARGALNEAFSSLYKGTDAAGALTAAQKEWHRVLKPAQHFARAVAGAKTDGDATQRALGIWRKIGPASRAAVDPTGEVAAVIKEIGRARPVGGMIGGVTAGLVGAGGVGVAANRFWQGDVGGGFTALLGGASAAALRYPGLAGVAARGAAGPAARTAAAVAGALPGAEAPLEPEAIVPPAAEEAPEATEAPAPRATGPLQRELDAVAGVVGIPPDLIRSLLQRESTGNPRAVSPQGARGLMQIMPGTFVRYRGRISELTGREASIDDPLDNLIAGALHLRDDLDATGGDVFAAIRRYHGGPDPRQQGPKGLAHARNVTRDYAGTLR